MATLVPRRIFLPPILAIVAHVLSTLSPTFVLIRPFVFGLGGAFGERFRNGNGVVKCLSATSIKLEAILEVEEGILVGHVAYFDHEGSELVDVVVDTTYLFEAA